MISSINSNGKNTIFGGKKELYDAAVEAGATVLPGVSTDGYTYDGSEAIDGDKFLGLALDEVNEDDKTEERINAWCFTPSTRRMSLLP